MLTEVKHTSIPFVKFYTEFRNKFKGKRYLIICKRNYMVVVIDFVRHSCTVISRPVLMKSSDLSMYYNVYTSSGTVVTNPRFQARSSQFFMDRDNFKLLMVTHICGNIWKYFTL